MLGSSRQALDAELLAIYGDPKVAEELHREVEEMLPAQAWPPDDDLVEHGLPARRRAAR